MLHMSCLVTWLWNNPSTWNVSLGQFISWQHLWWKGDKVAWLQEYEFQQGSQYLKTEVSRRNKMLESDTLDSLTRWPDPQLHASSPLCRFSISYSISQGSAPWQSKALRERVCRHHHENVPSSLLMSSRRSPDQDTIDNPMGHLHICGVQAGTAPLSADWQWVNLVLSSVP